MGDIFVSYTSSDKDWAFWIGKELEALGHTPHIHEWEIERGANIYAWMEERHDAADHVLCIVSDEYLKAPYSTLERHAAQWQAANKRPGFVLLVAVKPCRLPTLSDFYRRCELFGVPEEAASLRFREFMSRRDAPETVAFPGTVAAVTNVPIRVVTHFMGRDDAIVAVEKSLKRNERRVAITALHGLRGLASRRLPPPMPKNIAAIIAPYGGSARKWSSPCAPISSRLARGSNGPRRTRRRRTRLPP